MQVQGLCVNFLIAAFVLENCHTVSIKPRVDICLKIASKAHNLKSDEKGALSSISKYFLRGVVPVWVSSKGDVE